MKIMLSANIFKTVKHVNVKNPRRIKEPRAVPTETTFIDTDGDIAALRRRRAHVLYEYRRYNIRQVDVAKASGYSQGSVSGYVTGSISPNNPAYERITYVFEQMIAKAKEAEELSTDD